MTAPSLEHVCDIEAKLSPPHELGREPAGTRRIIPIVGGKITGDRLSGTILNVGADWQLVTSDGVAHLEARYAFQTAEGAVVEVSSIGIRDASEEVASRIASGEQVSPDEYYMRTAIRLKTGDERYAWVNRSIFVASGGKVGNTVRLSVYRVA